MLGSTLRSVVCLRFARLPIPPEYLPDPPRLLRLVFELVLRRPIEPAALIGLVDYFRLRRNPAHRRRVRLSRSISPSFGSEFLPCQLGAEILFLLANVVFVANRVNERNRTSLFPKRILFLESEVTAMSTEENIARQRF